ncbi:GPCR fungal pheromone mating factor, partial [Vararia minispora EC-137]
YIVQGVRFQILEGFGCSSSINVYGVTFLTIYCWPLILPTISILFYCPKIFYVFYRYNKETNESLRSDISISRPNYLRLLALAAMDIVLTLPLNVISVVESVKNLLPGNPFQFYRGWSYTHAEWAPVSFSYTVIKAQGGWQLTNYYLSRWSSVALALTIFALFGLTADARGTYRRGIYAIGERLGL